MKIKNMDLSNFAGFESVKVSFNENITFLIGPNTAGKSRIGLLGVQAILQGISEKAMSGTIPVIGERYRFLSNEGNDKSVNKLILIDEKNNNAEIKLTRTISKEKSVLKIEAPDSYEYLNQEWLNGLFNHYLIAPKAFTALSSLDQAKVLGINTSSFDRKLANLKLEYTEINRDLTKLGKPEKVEEVKPVDITALNERKQKIRVLLSSLKLDYNEQYNVKLNEWKKEVEAERESIDQYNKQIIVRVEKRKRLTDIINVLWTEFLVECKDLTGLLEAFNKMDYEKKPYPDFEETRPEYDTTVGTDSELDEIDKQIMDATTTNEKAFLYTQYADKLERIQMTETLLKDNKAAQAVVINERNTYLKSLNLGLPGIGVSDEGMLQYNDNPIREPFLSSGELIKVVTGLMSSRHPDFKYVFLQDFILLDSENQQAVLDTLIGNGFQVVIEWVGSEMIEGHNCILLKDSKVIDTSFAQD